MTHKAKLVPKANLTTEQVSLLNQLYCLLNDCCIKCHGEDLFTDDILGIVLASHGWECDEFYRQFE